MWHANEFFSTKIHQFELFCSRLTSKRVKVLLASFRFFESCQVRMGPYYKFIKWTATKIAPAGIMRFVLKCSKYAYYDIKVFRIMIQSTFEMFQQILERITTWNPRIKYVMLLSFFFKVVRPWKFIEPSYCLERLAFFLKNTFMNVLQISLRSFFLDWLTHWTQKPWPIILFKRQYTLSVLRKRAEIVRIAA